MNASLHRIWTVIFIILAALVSGCGPEDISPAPLCAYLPEPAAPPTVPKPQRAPLTLEAALRKCEGEKHVAEDYEKKGYRIVASTETPGGQVIDWIAVESMPGSDEPTPPALEDLEPPPGMERGKTELEMYPELRGRAGTLGVTRMTFPEYVSGETGTRSLEEYLLQKSAEEPGRIDGLNRLYAGYKFRNISLGVGGTVNTYAASEIEDLTFSVMEMAVACVNPYSGKEEAIGIVASRDRRNFNKSHPNDSRLYLQVERYILTPNADPVKRGGWHGGDDQVAGFVSIANPSSFRPNMLIQPSVIGGPLYFHRFEIRWWDSKWWLGYQGEWFGYYLASWFEEMSAYACVVFWYLEVYDGTPETWTYTDGGSGEFAQYGNPNAAFFKQLTYFDTQNRQHWLLKDAADPVTPYDPACYTATPMDYSWIPGVENGFYCDGPGNDPIKAPSCK